VELEPELAEIFVDEARGHVAVVADAAQSRQARLSAARTLATAAGLCGLGELKAAAELTAESIAALDEATAAAAVRTIEALLASVTPAAAVTDVELGELLAGFREEAGEHLDALQAALLALEKEPGRRELVDELLRKAHTLKGSASMVGLPPISETAHALESVLVLIRSGALGGEGVFDALHAALDGLRALVPVGHRPEATELARGLRADLDALRRGALRLPTQPVRPVVDTGRRREDQAIVLRVDPARLDQLMDGVGELVFDRTRIERRVGEIRNILRDLAKARSGLRSLFRAHKLPRLGELEEAFAVHVAELGRAGSALLEDADALRRTTRMLQNGLTQVRMMKVSWLFQRVARPLRDLERLEGKRVSVVTSGGEVELDKAVVEKVTDPLLQLLRNALAHGVEPAATRLALGKPAEGTITLSARHEGESVFLEVADDGAGIDAGKVRASLVASGRLSASAATDEQIIAAIFEPGVSTRDEVDELAGRGVGLDVVRETIAGLGGEISVSSIPRQGTRFTLRLPLTTAISQAFLFKVGGQVYALPNVHVIEATTIESSTPAMPPLLPHRGQAVPLVSLHLLLGALAPTDARRVPVLVLEFAGRRLAATCDKVIGPREIVVKSLGPLLAPLGLYAGATISGSGKVQLILDPATLVQAAYPASAPTGETGVFPPVAAEPPAPAEPQTRPRILVADDSRSVRDALARMLAAGGYVVDQAIDGQDAWDMLQEMRYDVLVTDLEMPRLGGEELVARLRADATLGTIGVIAISSRKEGAGSADAFIAKPVLAKQLVREIERLLRR